MAHRSIEETFQAVKPRGRNAVPDAPTIGIGITGTGSDLTSSLSQAGQQIAQLQAAYTQQVALITANTQAIQSNTSAQANHSGLDTAGKAASSFLGGFGLLAPLISGISKLFGAPSTPAPHPVYTPPAPVAMSGNLRESAPATPVDTGSQANTSQKAAPISHVTVNVSAMDSQSFMDRSADIANAVREAMLNLHPINDVVANL
jgi:hypothetical protein